MPDEFGDPAETEAGDGDDLRAEIRAAVAEVRREGYKAAFVYAAVDAVLVLLVVHLATGVVGHPVLDAPVAPNTLGSLGLPAADRGAIAAVAAGCLAFVAEVAVRVRRPLVEQFEAANPEVREALRTARDASRAGRSNPMVRALYADVLDRLRGTSSLGLVHTGRVGGTVALALILSFATVQASVAGVAIGGPGAGGEGASVAAGSPAGDANLSEADLQPGDEILGEATNVSAGSENVTAEIASGPGGEGGEEWDYGTGGDGDGGESVRARRAGYASPERVEDAALVRRYTQKLQENATDV